MLLIKEDLKGWCFGRCHQRKQTTLTTVGVVLADEKKENKQLYPEGNDKIDHEVVIKYVPFVGDSKRALDEYSS
jgi:hypothetical protein